MITLDMRVVLAKSIGKRPIGMKERFVNRSHGSSHTAITASNDLPGTRIRSRV